MRIVGDAVEFGEVQIAEQRTPPAAGSSATSPGGCIDIRQQKGAPIIRFDEVPGGIKRDRMRIGMGTARPDQAGKSVQRTIDTTNINASSGNIGQGGI